MNRVYCTGFYVLNATGTRALCVLTFMHICMYGSLLDISRQLACMKLGSREKYQPIQYCWVHISRLLGYLVSYMPFAYRYPTNLLQHPDRTAFALARSCCPVWVLQHNIFISAVSERKVL